MDNRDPEHGEFHAIIKDGTGGSPNLEVVVATTDVLCVFMPVLLKRYSESDLEVYLRRGFQGSLVLIFGLIWSGERRTPVRSLAANDLLTLALNGLLGERPTGMLFRSLTDRSVDPRLRRAAQRLQSALRTHGCEVSVRMVDGHFDLGEGFLKLRPRDELGEDYRTRGDYSRRGGRSPGGDRHGVGPTFEDYEAEAAAEAQAPEAEDAPEAEMDDGPPKRR
jgi:hypothetical protein